MEIIQPIILGIIQGVAEFLPISSSGHLILVPIFFDWKDQGLAFDVALHWGTLIAVASYFWKDWIDIFRKSYLFILLRNIKHQIPNTKQITNTKLQNSNKTESKVSRFKLHVDYLNSDLFFIIIISTVPGILAGLFLGDYAETIFRNPLLVASSLFFGAILLFYSDKLGKKDMGLSNITLKEGMLIGLSQMFAIVPGVSRSGITISAALFLGLNRTSSARFSFLLSTPIILGAGIKELPKMLEKGIGSDMLIGVFFAALGGYLAIKCMIRYLENKSYNIFVVYRIILAAIIVLLFLK